MSVSGLAFIYKQITSFKNDLSKLQEKKLKLGPNTEYKKGIELAFLNSLVILEPITEDIELFIPDTPCPDGQILRLHHHNSFSNTSSYIIKDKTGTTLIKIGANQSYSLIWRENSSDWVIMQGIINLQ